MYNKVQVSYYKPVLDRKELRGRVGGLGGGWCNCCGVTLYSICPTGLFCYEGEIGEFCTMTVAEYIMPLIDICIPRKVQTIGVSYIHVLYTTLEPSISYSGSALFHD